MRRFDPDPRLQILQQLSFVSLTHSSATVAGAVLFACFPLTELRGRLSETSALRKQSVARSRTALAAAWPVTDAAGLGERT